MLNKESIQIEEITDKKLWEEFVFSQTPNVFLQSWNWGEVHQMLGKKIKRLGVFFANKLVGAALIIKEKAKRGDHFIVPGGPILDNWDEMKVVSALFNQLRGEGKKEKAIFIRVRPNIADTSENHRLLKKLGFHRAPMHLHAETTLHLDLTQSEAQILAGMRKNTRYCIRRAIRDGVKTKISKEIKDINLLYQLQMEVVKRRKFIPFSREFFEKHFTAFVDDDQIAFIKANYHGETLAIGMFIFYGDTASYHYSGSSLKYSNIFASYAMLWEAIKEAKRQGCQIFDFWGVAPTDDPRHRFAGVTRFKKGFGGERVDYLPAQDYPLSSLYWPTYMFETIRRKIRRL